MSAKLIKIVLPDHLTHFYPEMKYHSASAIFEKKALSVLSDLTESPVHRRYG